MIHSTSVKFAALASAAAIAFPVATAGAQEFKAKTVTFIVGFPPAGGYDTIARLFARHYGKYLPGNPTIVVQNLPGAGSLTAANLLFNSAPKDGSQFGLFASSAAVEPLIGNKSAKFDVTKFGWIGNLNRDVAACGAWHTSGIATWEDAVKKGKVRFGASGPAAVTSQHASFLANVLKLPFQVIHGFGGTGPINLAMKRGEVDASCGMFVSSVRGSFRQDYEKGDLRIFIQFGSKDEPYFKGAKNVYSLMKTEDDRKLAEFIFGQGEITRPLAAPPGMPATILATMRAGFDKAVKDPGYIADLTKAKLEPETMTGEETAKAFAGFAAAPKALLDRAKQVVAPPGK